MSSGPAQLPEFVVLRLAGAEKPSQLESESLLSDEDEEDDEEDESELELLPLRRDGWVWVSTALGFSTEREEKKNGWKQFYQ